MRLSRWITIGLCALATASPACATGQNAMTVTIDPTQVNQTIEGFGASGAWWAQDVGGWPDEKRDAILDLLYTDTGAALTMYRFNIGAGGDDTIRDPWRRAETFEVSPGKYDWSRDANAIRVLCEVRRRGAERFVFFANSPPARLTRNGLVSGGPNGGNNLPPENYAAFSRYLLDITDHWRQELCLPYVSVSPINEPQWRWGEDGRSQEGAHYNPRQVVDVLRVVAGDIERRGLPIELEGPESGAWEGGGARAYVRAILEDAVLSQAMDKIGIHSYWSDADDRVAMVQMLRSRGAQVKLAMTEWCQMRRGRDVGMDSAMHQANVMWEDFVLGGVVSWEAWIAVSKYDYRDGLIYINPGEREIVVPKRLWAMANFSRFVRPGMRRVEASSSNKDVRVAAFSDAESGRVVCVLINNSGQTQDAGVSLDNLKGKTVTAYTTSDAADLAERKGVTLDGVQLPAQSVTTVVIDREP